MDETYDPNYPTVLQKCTGWPWKRNGVRGCKVISGDKAGSHRQAQYRPIAWTEGLADEEEDAANADLMVASPDMCEALAYGSAAGNGPESLETLAEFILDHADHDHADGWATWLQAKAELAAQALALAEGKKT